jgi:hypothetical protein
MHWQPALIERLSRVRDMRMRLAEMELVRADAVLAASRLAEQDARQNVEHTGQRSEREIAEADQTLLSRRVGGRHGITNWHATRTRSQRAVQIAKEAADDAASERLEQELKCSAARKRWRHMRLQVERMKLLGEDLIERAR